MYAIPVRPPEEGRARVVEAGKSYEPVHETVETFGLLLAAVNASSTAKDIEASTGASFLMVPPFPLGRRSTHPIDFTT